MQKQIKEITPMFLYNFGIFNFLLCFDFFKWLDHFINSKFLFPLIANYQFLINPNYLGILSELVQSFFTRTNNSKNIFVPKSLSISRRDCVPMK